MKLNESPNKYEKKIENEENGKKKINGLMLGFNANKGTFQYKKKSQERDMNDLNANRKSRAISENKKEVKVISMEYKKNNREL